MYSGGGPEETDGAGTESQARGSGFSGRSFGRRKPEDKKWYHGLVVSFFLGGGLRARAWGAATAERWRKPPAQLKANG